MESHNTREQSQRKYLSSNLNITKMYELYLLKNSHLKMENLPKLCSYTKFMENFKLGFHKPKKDQCSTCITYTNMAAEKNVKMLNMGSISLTKIWQGL